jgi:hypothetical protein
LEGLPNDVIPYGSVKCLMQNPSNFDVLTSGEIKDPWNTKIVIQMITLVFPDNVGILRQPSIDVYLDGSRPTLVTNENKNSLTPFIYADGFHGEFEDLVPDLCEGISVNIKYDEYYNSTYLDGLSDHDVKVLKKCLGDSDWDSSSNQDVFNWDPGSDEYPHLIKLADTSNSERSRICNFTETNNVNHLFRQNYYCDSYETNYTYYATERYFTCEITACGGSTITVNLCDRFTGDTYIKLVDEAGNVLIENDDSYQTCGSSGLASYFTYEISGDTQVCNTYYLREGCYGDSTCSGQPHVTVRPTSKWCENYNLPGFYAPVIYKNIGGQERFWLYSRPDYDYDNYTQFNVFTTTGRLSRRGYDSYALNSFGKWKFNNLFGNTLYSVDYHCPAPFSVDPFTSSCYYKLPFNSTWGNARTICGNYGANLVTIESATENEYIYSTFGPVWIGYNDIDVEGNNNKSTLYLLLST